MATVYAGVGTHVAKMVSGSTVLDQEAQKLASRVRSGWAAHHKSSGAGFFTTIKVKSIPGKKGVKDRLVYSDAYGIISAEFGHWTPGKKRRFVPGLHVFKKVADSP